MSYWEGSWSEPIVLTEDEIFSRPIVNSPRGGDGDAPLVQQWGDFGAEDFEAVANLGEVNVHSASMFPRMSQAAFAPQQVVAPADHPVSAPHRLQRRSSEGTLASIVEESDRRMRDQAMAAAWPSEPTIRRAYNNATPSLRRRPPGTSPALYSKEGWRTATGKAPMPFPVLHGKPKKHVDPQVFESMLKHPFLDFPPTLHAMMMLARPELLPPILSNVARARPQPPSGARPQRPSGARRQPLSGARPQRPSGARRQPLSGAPEVARSMPTTTRINSVQEQGFTMAPDRTQPGPLVSAGMGSNCPPPPSPCPIRALSLPLPEPDEMEISPLSPTTLSLLQPDEDMMSVMANLEFGSLQIGGSEPQPQVTFFELDDDYPSPSSDGGMTTWDLGIDLWDHCSMDSPRFLDHMQGQPPQVHAAPVANLAAPVADLAPPVADQAALVADQAARVADLAAPVADQAPPVADQAPPVADQAARVADQAALVADQAALVADQAALVADQAAPVADLAALVANQAPPVADQAAPVADQAAPEADQADVSMLDVSMPDVMSTDLPEKENQQPEVLQPVTGAVVEVLSRPRLKWTTELHRRFEVSVANLGGCHRATPKAVLRLMNCGPEVHVFHVKSHLQKHRLLEPLGRRGSKRQVRPRSASVTLDLSEPMQSDFSQADFNKETSQTIAKFTKQLEWSFEVQQTQMEHLNQMKRIMEHQQAVAASAASSSTPGVSIEFKVQVPRLVIVPKECAGIYPLDDEEIEE